jgi:hypothetical protein
MMRRASTYLALLGLAVLGLPATASAVPAVTFKPTVIPIPHFKGTGNFLGTGAGVQAVFTINGTESTGGVPSQLRKVVVDLPTGTKINPKGFSKCDASTLEASGPEGCPKASVASPIGNARVEAPIGGTTVGVTGTLQAFLSPNGGLNFYANSSAPISAQIISVGTFVTQEPGYGPKLEVLVPAIPTVPGAPNASIININVKVGAGLKKGKKVVYYGTLPSKCSKSAGLKWKTELTFESGETATAFAKTVCPKKKK